MFSIFSFSLLNISCISQKKFTTAEVTFFDGYTAEMLVYASKNSYFTFIRSKYKSDGDKIKFLIPEDVISVDNDYSKFVSMYFDEETYGMESYSFGKILAGDTNFALVETKYQMKTCSCKTSGAFFKGIFLYAGQNNFLKLKLDNKNNIYNRNEIAEFFKKNSNIPPPTEINSLNDLIEYLQDINN